MANQRGQIWIDPFQTRLVLRLLFYALVYQVAIWLIVFTFKIFLDRMAALTDEPVESFFSWGAVLMGLALLGLLTFDAVRYVHRLVGPIYRFRKAVQAIAAGETVELVRLRQEDFLKDFMGDFNVMLKVLADKGAIALKEEGESAESPAAR